MTQLVQSVPMPDLNTDPFRAERVEINSCDLNLAGHFADPKAVSLAYVKVSHSWFEDAKAYDVLFPASGQTNQIVTARVPADTHVATHVKPLIHPTTSVTVDDVERLVTVVIKYISRFRSRHVNRLIKSIRAFYPTIEILVADDSVKRSPTEAPYSIPVWARDDHTQLIILPEDSGLSLGRNILVHSVKTRFFVLFDDDFIVTRYTRIEKFLGILLLNSDVIVVGGGLSLGATPDTNNPSYESYGLDATVIAHSKTAVFKKSAAPLDAHGCRRVDATFNFFMADTAAIRKTPWNPELKINEHEALFLLIKLSGKKVVECPGVHIFHNNKLSDRKLYNVKSHRMESYKYSAPICAQFPGMLVLRSVWWSIVCDHGRGAFCERQAGQPLQHVHCMSTDIDSPGRVWNDAAGHPTKHIQDVYQPIKIAGKKLLPSVLDVSGRQKNLNAGNTDLANGGFQSAPLHVDIFIAVITWGGNHAARQASRNAMSTMLAQIKKQRTGFRIEYRFFVGNVTKPVPVRREQQHYRDIVMLPEASDGYDNLVSKVTAAMRWIAANVPADYIVKVDDDVFLNLPALARSILVKNLPKTRLLAGRAVPLGYRPIRTRGHKWELSYDVYKGDFLPRYANGPCYVVSMDVADYIGRYQRLVRLNPFRIEDVFMGIILSNIDDAVVLALVFPVYRALYMEDSEGTN
eukprot:g5211.t1